MPALLERAAAERPLHVVVEDAQWADQSTRHMLSNLFARQFEGLVAIASSTLELGLAEQRGDVAAALDTYHSIVATLIGTWREEFQARLRMATPVVGVFGSAAPHMRAAERAAADAEIHRLYHCGHRFIAFHRVQGLEHGPETAAWMLRLDVERLRWQWASRVEPPEADELVGSWLETPPRS